MQILQKNDHNIVMTWVPKDYLKVYSGERERGTKWAGNLRRMKSSSRQRGVESFCRGLM